jgi:hypothetical protein
MKIIKIKKRSKWIFKNAKAAPFFTFCVIYDAIFLPFFLLKKLLTAEKVTQKVTDGGKSYSKSY